MFRADACFQIRELYRNWTIKDRNQVRMFMGVESQLSKYMERCYPDDKEYCMLALRFR